MAVVLRPAALADHAVRQFRMLIDGTWTDEAEGRTIERVAPGHGIVASRYVVASAVDAERGRSPPHGRPSTTAPGRR